jgi:serine/threonine-protein kinase RsbW
VIRLKVPCSLAHREMAMRVVESACRLVRPRRATDPRPDDFDDEVVTSFGEAFTNVVVHGGNPPGSEIEIEIETMSDRITIRLLDGGKPFDLSASPPPALDRLPESGLGVHLMKSWMDDVSYERRGAAGARNVLSMTKRLGDFSREDRGDVSVLRIEGVLDANSVPNIRGTIEALVAERRKSVTVDASALRHIDSSGVGVIVSLYKRCKAFGGTVRVIGLKDQPLSIFRLLRLDKVFDLA